MDDDGGYFALRRTRQSAIQYRCRHPRTLQGGGVADGYGQSGGDTRKRGSRAGGDGHPCIR